MTVTQAPYTPNGYEDAVSTKLLATHCCMCNRPLRDARSVELGIGPICEEKFGVEAGEVGSPDLDLLAQGIAMAPEEMRASIASAASVGDYRAAANKAIWHAAMAASYTGPDWKVVVAAAEKVAAGCGYWATAGRFRSFYVEGQRAGSEIKLVRVGPGRICAKTPFNADFIKAVKSVPGRVWVGHQKVWCVPEDKIDHLVAALSVAFAGQLMLDLEGNMAVVPRDVQFPPPVTPPAGPPTSATNETDAWTIEEARKALQKGERVIDPEGREGIVRWVGTNRDGSPRVGLGYKGVSGGLTFFSYRELKMVSNDKDQKSELKAASADAKKENAPAPAPSAPARSVPSMAFPYQVEGISWLDKKRSGLLADEPGLGKTLQACVAADAPVVVVCPATLRVEWLREMGKWRSEFSVVVVSGRKPYPLAKYKAADVVVINYDVLPSHAKTLGRLRIATLIADEAHYLKTLRQQRGKYVGSNRAKAFIELSQKAGRVFLLTATPLMNRPKELWPLLHFLDPGRWDSYQKFGMRFCDGKLETIRARGRTIKTWNFDGASNGKELFSILTENYMLRRTKDILPLPPKSRQTKLIALEPRAAKEYKRAAKDFIDWVGTKGGPEAVEKHMRAQAITKMTALRKLAAVGKIPYAVEWITGHYESTGRPLVVMAYHRAVTEGLTKLLKETEVEHGGVTRKLRVGQIIGGVAEARRTAYKDAFQAGELDVLVCSIPAAGAGLTLTAASETLFLERTWRPMDQVQAEDRIWRIGQDNKCTITYVQAENTVDGVIAAMLVDKQATIAERIDGLDLTQDQAEDYVFGRMFGLTEGLAEMSQNPRQLAFPTIEWVDADLF